MSDLNRQDVAQLASAVAAGKLRAEAVVEACLARAAERDGEVKAFAHLAGDAALAEARRLDKAGSTGPLHGIPVVVKDVIDTAGMPTSYGSEIWKGHVPALDAACVAQVKAAGGIVLGKTVTTEFALRTPGPTANPHNLAHTPGGSSQGTAAAVADFMAPLGFGTQTAGSVGRPAAYCGVVGYKPTYNLINRAGLKFAAENLDTIGVMGRSVPDVALLVGALANATLGAFEAKASPPRIGFCRSPLWGKAEDYTHALLEQSAATLAKAGAKVVDLDLPAACGDLVDAQATICTYEIGRALAWEYAHHPKLMSDPLRERVGKGVAMKQDVYLAARKTQERCIAEAAGIWSDVDILLTPAAQGEAPKGLQATGDPMFSTIWTTLHLPCVVLPVAKGPTGLPLAVQVVGPRHADAAMLTAAHWVHRALA
ncbi:MAG: amidase [Acetobacterales bacterium]